MGHLRPCGEAVRIGDTLMAYRPWGEDRAADRRTMQRYGGSVTVTKGNRWQPLGQRVKVVRWVDGSEPVVSTRDAGGC